MLASDEPETEVPALGWALGLERPAARARAPQLRGWVLEPPQASRGLR